MFHSAHETEECEDRTERKVVGSMDLVRNSVYSQNFQSFGSKV